MGYWYRLPVDCTVKYIIIIITIMIIIIIIITSTKINSSIYRYRHVIYAQRNLTSYIIIYIIACKSVTQYLLH